ncbi:MAG: hypothetical protein ACLFWL_02315 [Candidatus Brocadiia bacterium]
MRSWAEWLDRTAQDTSLESHRRQFVKSAEKILQTPLIRRVYTYDEVGENRTRLDGRAEYLEDEIRETFALAMSDCSTNGTAAKELPLLAAAYRLTGREDFRQRLVEQLREMTTWLPLQRPGWTLFKPGARLPEDGMDGSWLATGSGVRAIGDALEIMPDESIPQELLNGLHELLEREIEQIVGDWREKRQWFVRTENPRTNQWALPTEGLVRACLIKGPQQCEEQYQLGVKI